MRTVRELVWQRTLCWPAGCVSTVCVPAYLFAWVMWAFGAYRARAGVLRCFLFLFSKNAAWYLHVRVVCRPDLILRGRRLLASCAGYRRRSRGEHGSI